MVPDCFIAFDKHIFGIPYGENMYVDIGMEGNLEKAMVLNAALGIREKELLVTWICSFAGNWKLAGDLVDYDVPALFRIFTF